MSGKQKKKAVFLDRDGVLNEVVFHPGIKKPSSPWKIEEFKLFKGIEEPLKRLEEMGFLLFVFSNQPDISRGNIKKGTTEEINKILYNTFPITEIMVCPHDDVDHCSCRKPKPGMILELSKKHDIDLKRSFVIGDGAKDMKAGKNAGVTTILIQTDYNQKVIAENNVKSLKESLKLISSHERIRLNHGV